MNRIKIIHIIIKLAPGGTEYKLLNLIKDTSRLFEHHVLVLTSVEKEFILMAEENNVSLVVLNIKGISSFLYSITTILKVYKDLNFSLIIGWLYHGNLMAFLFKILTRSNAKLIWNIRSSLSAMKGAPFHRKIVINISKHFSNKISATIYNSKLSKQEHIEYGFFSKQNSVINNGLDLDKFKPIPNAKEIICKELGIDNEDILVGMCARFHKVKNFPLLIDAINKMHIKGRNISCILCGDGVSMKNATLAPLIKNTIRPKKFFLLGHRTDLPLIYSALDLHLLTSNSESASNSIIESMACGTICLSADVGNSREILEDHQIFHPKDIISLSEKLEDILSIDRSDKVNDSSRTIIEGNFSSTAMNEEFTNLYNSIIGSDHSTHE